MTTGSLWLDAHHSRIIEIIGSLHGLEFALVSPDLRILHTTPEFDRLIPSVSKNDYLPEVMWEFAGVESVLEDILRGRQSEFRLERVNQQGADGEVRYLDYIVVLTDPADTSAGLLLILEDTTSFGELEQVIMQERNELALTRAQLESELAARKKAQSAEREQRVLAEALRDSAAALISTLTTDETLDRILSNIGVVVEYDAADLKLIDNGHIKLVRTTGFDDAEKSVAMQSLRFDIATMPVLRRMVESEDPVIIPDVHSYSGWVEVEGTEWVRAFLGTPILLSDEPIGFISLYSARKDFFRSKDVVHLGAFAGQAALAINNARLHEQATAAAISEERQQLARELHDSVSQMLFSANVTTQTLLREKDIHKIRNELAALERLTQGALAEMRSLLLELRPTALHDIPLPDALSQLLKAALGRSMAEICLETDGFSTLLDPDIKLVFYRVAQESLNNIVKHARAQTVTIVLQETDDAVILDIRDDGDGFDPALTAIGHGLHIMQERAQAAGAALVIKSKIGAGTQLALTWPRNK